MIAPDMATMLGLFHGWKIRAHTSETLDYGTERSFNSYYGG